MKIIEHRFRPGIICFYNEITRRRSYWFSAHNLFPEGMSNDESVKIILQWTEKDIKEAILKANIAYAHWEEHKFDHELILSPKGDQAWN